MPLSIGDAILRFVGDTSDLDQAFARIPAQTEAAMGAAAASVGGLGGAVQGVNFELDATAENVPYAGEVIKEAMGKAENSAHEARGEAALLGELFGIHLPRHVRSFVAELPGVGTALSAAFAATAVLFLFEALVQAVEKIKAFAEEGEKIKAAMEAWDDAQRKTFNNLSDGVLQAQARLDDLTGNHLEALRLKLQLIDNQTLDKLDDALKKLGSDADKIFTDLQRNWFMKNFFDMPGSEEAQAKLKALQKTVSEALQARTPQAYSEALKLLQGEFDTTTKRIQALDDQLQQHNRDMQTALGPKAKITEAPDEKEILAWNQLGKTIRGYISDVQEAKKEADTTKTADRKQEADKEAQIAEQLAKKQEQLFFEIAKAHAALQKQLDEQSKDTSKIETLRLDQEMKDRTEKNKDDLDSLRQTIQAKLALIDGEVQGSQQKYDQQSILLKTQYDKGLITAQQYLVSLKALNAKEVQDLAQMLDQKEKLVILEAQNEAARRGKILTDAEAKELKGYVDVENKKTQLQADFENKFLKEQDKITAKLAKDYATIDKLLDAYGKKLRSAENDLKGFGKVADATLNDVSKAFGAAIEQWVSGQKSFGDALKSALQQYLAQVAGKAAIDALYFAAWGIADSFWNPARAGADFAAAAEFAAIAAVAGGTAKAMGGGQGSGGSGSSGGSKQQATIQQNASTQAVNPPTASANVPRLFSGAIVTQPTMAMIGDGPNGGSRPEGVFPLDDPRAAQAINRLFGGEGTGGGIHNHFYVRGMLSTQDLAKTARIITRGAQTGRLRVSVANSARVTKRG